MSFIYGKNTNNNKTERKKDTKRILITSVVVNIIIAAIFIVISYLIVSLEENREAYTKLVFLPIAAFVGAFISTLLNKDLLMNLAGSAAIVALSFLIFVNFSLLVIPWLLLYMISAILGIATAFIASTFR